MKHIGFLGNCQSYVLYNKCTCIERPGLEGDAGIEDRICERKTMIK